MSSQYVLNGQWVNSYGSLMDIQVSQTGLLIGRYASTTGASGTYTIIGACRPENPTPICGQPLALSIYWHPLPSSAGEFNETWHWVSTYCGQLGYVANAVDNSDNKVLALSVINSLVATTPYNGSSIGDYIDKLTFSQDTEQASSLARLTLPSTQTTAPSPLNGSWVAESDDMGLSLSLNNPDTGYSSGVLSYQGSKVSLHGFSDVLPLTDTPQRLAVSLSGLAHDNAPLSISGYLDIIADTLTLLQWTAKGTAPGDAYLQANAQNIRLSRAR